MDTKNPEIITEILNADINDRIKLIRDNAKKLSVSDLNELSLKMVKRLNEALEQEKAKPEEHKVVVDIETLTPTQRKQDEFLITTNANSEAEEIPEFLQKHMEEQGADTPASNKWRTWFFAVLTVSAVYAPTLTLLGATIATLAPLSTWFIATLFGVFGFKTKAMMQTSSALLLATTASVLKIDGIMAMDFNNPQMMMFVLSIAMLIASTLWKQR